MSAVLVIAGSDSSGGAGIVRDLRTLADLGMAGLCAITAVTAQTERALLGLQVVAPQLVSAQIESAFATCAIGAVKIGMLANAATVRAVTQALARHARLPVVLDPVLISSAGASLLDEEGRQVLLGSLLRNVALLTPNIPEAALLLGQPGAQAEDAAGAQARQLLALGARAVLLKGGHAGGTESVDLLVRGDGVERLSGARIAAHMRGTGCALATAIAAYLAQGAQLASACAQAKQYVAAQLQRQA